MDAEAFRAAVRGRRRIKALLLDQKAIAGIGNIYADESLFAAGIHPETPADSLCVEAKDRLFRSLRQVLERAVAECGSSISDYRDADGNPGAFQNSFAVYGRPGPDQGGGAKQRDLSALPAQTADKALGKRLRIGYFGYR